jgi:hypothetical protein
MKHIAQMAKFFVGVRHQRVVASQDFDAAQATRAFAHAGGFDACGNLAASVEDRFTDAALGNFG